MAIGREWILDSFAVNRRLYAISALGRERLYPPTCPRL